MRWRHFFSDCTVFRGLLIDGALKAGFESKAPMLIRFTAGSRSQPWTKNCVALGLSYGFSEPLESTSINLIQSGIAQFPELFPSRQAEAVPRREYNRQMGLSYERVRDFIILHDKLNTRAEPLWRYCPEMPIPDTLANYIELFRARGDVASYDWDHFAEASWIAVTNGQGLLSRFAGPLADGCRWRTCAR